MIGENPTTSSIVRVGHGSPIDFVLGHISRSWFVFAPAKFYAAITRSPCFGSVLRSTARI